MPSMIFSPTEVISKSSTSVKNEKYLIDDSETNYCTLYGNVVLGYDFSALPSNISKITGISVEVVFNRKGGSSTKLSTTLLDRQSGGSLSDGTISKSGLTYNVKEANIFSFPGATSQVNADLSFLRENRLTCKVGADASGSYAYTVKIQIDYELLISFSITTNATPENAGIVSGGGTYENGKTATLTATPNDGYKFVRWSDDNINASRTVTVTGDVTYTAYFEKIRIYIGQKKVLAVYCGTKKISIYCGTQKLI